MGGEEDEKGELAAEGRVEQQARGLWLQGNAMLFNPNNKYVWLWWQLSVLLTYWNLFQVNRCESRQPQPDVVLYCLHLQIIPFVKRITPSRNSRLSIPRRFPSPSPTMTADQLS